MRLLCAAAASLSLGLFVALSAPNQPTRAERLKKIEKRFDEEMADLTKRLGKAQSAAEVRGVQAEMRELVAISASKLLDLAKDDPKDDVGFAACEYLVKIAGRANVEGLKDIDAGAALLAEHHAANPKIKPLLFPALNLGKASDKLLAAVSEKGADKETRATALLIMGYRAGEEADEEENDQRLAAAIARAVALLEKAAKEGPDVKVGDSGKTVAEHAKRMVDGLKGITIVSAGKPAPDVESVDLDGVVTKLSKLKGKVVVLDFWATWCGPCQQMIPHTRKLVEKMKDRPFEFVSVSADDDKRTLERFLEQTPMPWTHWWDDGRTSVAFRKFRVRAYPTIYLIDHAGVVRQKWVGIPGNDPNSDVMDRAVEALVKEAEKAKN